MKREVLRIVLIFVLCFVLAVGACLLCACIMDRVEPLASAEEYEREELREEDPVQLRSDPVRSINTTLPDNGVVGDNLLSNTDFSVFDNAESFFTVLSNVSLSFNAEYLCAQFVSSDAQSQIQCDLPSSLASQLLETTVTLSCYTDQGLCSLTVSNIVDDNYSSSSFTFSNGWSFRFRRLGAGRKLFIQILRSSSPTTSMLFYWFKLEFGSYFTGYVYNDYFNYGYDQGVVDGFDQGYSEGVQYGYDVGFLDGSQAYARNVETLAFNGVDPENRLSFGWSNLGISSAAELQSIYFSLSSYWFDQNGYVILESGTGPVLDSNDNVVGISLYLSTVLDFLSYEDLTTVSFPWIVVTFLEHESYLYLHDPNFPSNWNPVQYPRAKEVTVVAQLGVSEWLDKVSTSSESIGYKTGYTAGYDAGLGVGYNNGYSYAIQINETGDWRSMISALIGVPVLYIRSFFDFQILGFNMLGLFQTLVTLSLFFFLLRFMMGKVSV